MFISTVSLLTSSAFGQSLQARQADDFVDSIGVNVHLHYYDTAYSDFEGKVVTSLEELGVRHIRDGICPVEDTTKPHRLRELFTKLEIRSTLIIDPRCESVPEAYNYITNVLGTDLITALEGPNEYDLSGAEDWLGELRAYQQSVYGIFKNDATTARIPVIGPSVTSEDAADQLGDVSRYADIVNLHNYYSFRNPETFGWGDNGYGSLTWQLDEVVRALDPTQTLPIMATETGYHNVLADEGIPETVAATYLPRLLLSQFENGISRTFIYELLDQRDDPSDREANFGLVRFDGSKKPAFDAVKNLIELLEDPGKGFLTDTLDVAIQGPDDLSSTLLQKRSGAFYLALWRDVASYDPSLAAQALPVSTANISLEFDEPIVSLKQVQLDENTIWKTLAFSGSVASLDVGPNVTLLEIVPARVQ